MVWPCANQTLFTKQIVGQIWPGGHSLLILAQRMERLKLENTCAPCVQTRTHAR